MASQQAKKRLPPSAYTVAFICPLEVEMSAARYMLDEEHHRLPTADGDTNQYILGEISGHNITIASLPMGYQGAAPVATVASHISRTFPSVILRILVGIGGGVPSQNADIRLGDVVVSVPEGTLGGVVEYDLGKRTPTGFQRKGFLCPPPKEWLAVLPRMRSDHRVQRNNVSGYISAMISRFPELKDYSRPENDVLYRADYHHNSECKTCEKCSMEEAVVRCTRRHPNDPVIHYGLIASGNQVIKDAIQRDEISNMAGGVLCFEMEAAGLMNDFQCIVIRGISDYADSHKNDLWQPYAAAAATGVAKEILSYIDPPSSMLFPPVYKP
ncbi:purine and uridine phosphorylase [Aspergillus granulosus]|uniref:Purine and uridine phosphorylase n=1 Tax=Aspergillus granulosus TaxID=176169 RepID=A0ABR4GVC7_9EURO